MSLPPQELPSSPFNGDVEAELLHWLGWEKHEEGMNDSWYWHSATHRWSKVHPPWGVILRDVQSMVTSSTSSVGAYSNTPQLTKPPPASGAAHPPASPPPPPPTSPPASGAAPPPPTTPPAADGAAWPPTTSPPPTQCCHSSHDWPAASSLECLINSFCLPPIHMEVHFYRHYTWISIVWQSC